MKEPFLRLLYWSNLIQSSPVSHVKSVESSLVHNRYAQHLRYDLGEIPADSLDLILSIVSFHVAYDGLRGEHGGAQEVYFGLGSRPFPALQGLHRELYHEPVGRFFVSLGLFFNALPLLRRESDVLL